jgi:hypothetical protein
LVTSACGGDDNGTTAEETSTSTTSEAPPDGDDEDGTTTTAGPVELTASWPGVTEDTIRVGFLEVDMETLVEMGLIDNNRGDPKHVIDILVAELNARGGIHGREVEVFYENILPVSSTDAEAACLRFNEDNDVFAVLGSYVGPTIGVDPCITDGGTIMIGGTPTPADLENANAPWLTTGAAAGRSLPALVELLHDEGRFVGPLGVVWASEDEGAALDVVVPDLDALGYDVAVKAVQTADAADRPQLAAQWETFVEKFRAEGVETVVLVQASAAINGANMLASLDFEGDVLVVSPGSLNTIGITAQVPLEELTGMVGSMGATADEIYALRATQECVDILEAGDPEITVVPSAEVPDGQRDWATPLIVHCARLRLFEMIAAAAGPDLTHATFVAAAEGLGEIELPGNPFASLGPGKLDASDSMRLATFDPTIGQFGGAAADGDLIRIPG